MPAGAVAGRSESARGRLERILALRRTCAHLSTRFEMLAWVVRGPLAARTFKNTTAAVQYLHRAESALTVAADTGTTTGTTSNRHTCSLAIVNDGKPQQIFSAHAFEFLCYATAGRWRAELTPPNGWPQALRRCPRPHSNVSIAGQGWAVDHAAGCSLSPSCCSLHSLQLLCVLGISSVPSKTVRTRWT